MPDDPYAFLDGVALAEQPKPADPYDFLDDSPATATPQPKPAETPEPEQSWFQKLTAPGTLVHTVGDTLGRGGEVTGNLLSAAGHAVGGNDLGTAWERIKSAGKAIPGAVAGAVDIADTPLRWMGAPSIQPTVDAAVGFTDQDRMSGQRLMKEAGLINRDDNPLLSVPGAIGFGIDVAKDPLTHTSGGLTKAGEEASKVSGAASEVANLDRNIARATELNNTPRVNQLQSYKNSLPELPTGSPLAPTTSAQVDAGQRALIQVGGAPVVQGKAVYDAMDKVGGALSQLSPVKALQHGPITQTAAEVGQHIQQSQSEFDAARKALHLLHETPLDAPKRAELSKTIQQWYDRWAPANSPVTGEQVAQSANKTFSPAAENSARFIQNALEGNGFTPPDAKDFVDGIKHAFDGWTDIEHKLAGNVGTGALQITPANKALFHTFDANSELIGNLTEAINGKLGGGTSINASGGLRQMVDKAHRAGLSVDELNQLLVEHGVVNKPGLLERVGLREPLPQAPLATDTGDVLFMRGSQHIRANGVQEYVDGLMQKQLARTEANPAFKYAKDFDLGPARGRATKLYFRTSDEAALAEKTLKLLVDPAQTGKMLQYLDSFNRSMRAGVTRVFPEFHMQNTISNRFQSTLEDVPFFGEHRSLAADIVAGKPVSVNLWGKTYDRDGILRLWEDAGGSKGGAFESALAEAAPLGQRPTKLAPIKNAAEHVAAVPAGIFTGILRKDPALAQHITGSMIEEVDRLAHFIAKAKQGYFPKQAVQSVDRSLFNYAPSALTPFEQNVARRTMLFYGYQRNVLPLIFNKALERPGPIAAMVRVGESGGRPESLPDYAQSGQTMGLPSSLHDALYGGKARNDAVVSSIPTPVSAALKPFGGFDKGLLPGLGSLVAQTTPAIKGPLEAVTGKDVFTGRDVTNKPPEILKAMGVNGVPPVVNTALKNLPTSRITQNVNQLEKPESKWNLLSKLVGSSVQQFDEGPQKFYSIQEKLKPQLQEFYNRGWIKKSDNNYYVDKSLPRGTVPDRVVKLVAQYNWAGTEAHKAKQGVEAAQARQ